MKHPKIAALCLTLMATQATNGFAATKPVRAAKAPEKWEPEVYDTSATKLPPGYQGTNSKRFHALFKAKVQTIKKGQFETTEEFEERTKDANKMLAPISTNRLYAFRVGMIEPKYDADNQVYQFSSPYSDYSCDRAKSDGWTLVCKIGIAWMADDKYRGSNAFGASRIVDRTRGAYFAVAIPNTPRMFGSVFQNPSLNGSSKFIDKLPISIDQARAIKNSVGVLFVGSVTGANIVEGEAIFAEPKVDHPSDIFVTTDAIPFDLQRIVYYAIPTGKILAQRIFERPRETGSQDEELRRWAEERPQD